jgi:hypothetical protein
VFLCNYSQTSYNNPSRQKFSNKSFSHSARAFWSSLPQDLRQYNPDPFTTVIPHHFFAHVHLNITRKTKICLFAIFSLLNPGCIWNDFLERDKSLILSFAVISYVIHPHLMYCFYLTDHIFRVAN